jgi:hypothetical protein
MHRARFSYLSQGPVLKICKFLPKAAGTATFRGYFTYR